MAFYDAIKTKSRFYRVHAKPDSEPSMLTLGITGGVASGKSVVCGLLAEKGMTVHSADELARKAVEPGTAAYDGIVAAFGSGILCADACLDRPKLRNMMISDIKVKNILEGLIHPVVIRLMHACFEDARKKGETVCCIEVPLLFESGFSRFFDFTLTVTALYDIRIKRMMKRDGISRPQAEALAKTQMPDDEKIKKADFVIKNNGDLDDLKAEFDSFYQMFMARLESRDKKA